MTSQQFLKLHSSFPPAFHAKPGESWKGYWRSVEFWLASEGAHLPPNVRASRLMQQMKERAGKIVSHLLVEDVSGTNGVELIKAEMEKSPIIRLLEFKEIDKKRQKFMRLSRYPHESLESYINRAEIYRHENDKSQAYKVGSRFYLGHLLDGAQLSGKDQALVRTTAGGLSEEMKVINSLLELADQLEGKVGFPIGRGEPEMPDDDEYLVQKRGRDREGMPSMPYKRDRDERHRRTNKYRKFRQVFHAILEDDDEAEQMPSEAFGEDGPDNEAASSTSESTSRIDEDEDEDIMPAEVYAQEYRAKKKINELKQMRQFFKGGHTDKTKQWVKEQQKKEPCFLCQKLGHWSRECPDRASKKPTRPAHAVHVTAGNILPEPGEWDMLASMAAYKEPLCLGIGFRGTRDCFMEQGPHVNPVVDHETFWSLRELHSSLILELGCMKSVAGTKWVNQHIQRLKSEGRWMKAEKEKESFRFGDGRELWSQYAFIFEATVLGVRVIIRLSVVPGECPPLLSKPACTQLGMVIDTEHHTVSSRKLKVSNYGLAQTFGGHYALPIAEFDPQTPPLHDPEVPSHVEAIPVYASESYGTHAIPEQTEDSRDMGSRREGSSGLRTWTRQDRQVPCALGTGRNGPLWETVIRRTVYDSNTGAKLLDEEVNRDTVVRQPLGNVHDTTTILMYRGLGPTARSPSVPGPMCKGTAAYRNSQHGFDPASRSLRPDFRAGGRDSSFIRLEQGGGGNRRSGGQGSTSLLDSGPATVGHPKPRRANGSPDPSPRTRFEPRSSRTRGHARNPSRGRWRRRIPRQSRTSRSTWTPSRRAQSFA